MLVERKTWKSPYLPLGQLNHIMEISKKTNADVILAIRKRHRRIRWFKGTEHGIEEIKIEGNNMRRGLGRENSVAIRKDRD